jgi:hypothetical protein
MGNERSVDDAKSSMSKSDPLIGIDVLKVRAPFFERHGGGSHIDLVEFSNKVKCNNSGYATHVK